jgi:MarR family transcriptional repressor of emrRAB
MLESDYRLDNLLGAFAISLSDNIQAITTYDLNHPLPSAIVQIGSFSGESSEKLAKNLNLSQSATARVENKLRYSEFIETTQSENDARAIRLILTKKGLEKRQEILSSRHTILSKITETLTEQEKNTLLEIIEKVFPVIVRDRCSSDYTCRLCDAEACPQDICPAELDSHVWKKRNKNLSNGASCK